MSQWSDIPVLGENPKVELGRRASSRAQTVAQTFQPITLLSSASSGTVAQRGDPMTAPGFSLPQGVALVLLYLKVTGTGGAGAALYVFDDAVNNAERGLAVSPVAAIAGSAQAWVAPGRVFWQLALGGASSAAYLIAAAGWIRNP